jgi:hypothetical protein
MFIATMRIMADMNAPPIIIMRGLAAPTPPNIITAIMPMEPTIGRTIMRMFVIPSGSGRSGGACICSSVSGGGGGAFVDGRTTNHPSVVVRRAAGPEGIPRAGRRAGRSLPAGRRAVHP